MFDAIGEGHRIMQEGPKKEIDLDKLERLAKAATPGPWYTLSEMCEGVGCDTIISKQGEICDFVGNMHNPYGDRSYIVAACNAVPELIARVRELEGRIAELAKENSGHKRVIHILENKVLELKGKPIPMEPRLPTCDALCRPRYILQSNCSNAAKEAGE